MEQLPIHNAREVHVSDRVTFAHNGSHLAGHVARKGRTYAHVVTDQGSEFRVPYPLLSRVLGAPQKHVQVCVETLRAQFQAGDRIAFVLGEEVLHGVLSRLNPRYAHVVCDNGREYRVPYARLQTLTPAPAATASAQRTDTDISAIAARARAWMAQYRLEQWSFQFDHATKRAGCCNYRDRVISLAHAYARTATDAEIADTILHEIAHALVGREHGHNQVWREQAMALGCSGQRCHDVQFSPPRYIVTCANGCWVATAERRTRGAVCKTCHGHVHYMTYTEERWQQYRAGALPLRPR